MRFVFAVLFLFIMETGVAQQQQPARDRDGNSIEVKKKTVIRSFPFVRTRDFPEVDNDDKFFIDRFCYFDEDGEEHCEDYKHKEIELILREACQVVGYHKRILNCADTRPIKQCKDNEPGLYYRVGNVVIESFFKDFENCAIETGCFFDYEKKEPVCDEESYKTLISCRLNVVKVAEERFCPKEWVPPG